MSKHSDLAAELFTKGYNCAQAVFGAFAEDLGIDFNTAVKISSSFGGGMGRMREVCGALTGCFMAAGLKYGYTDIRNQNAKAEHYKLIQQIAENFKKANGSIICRELLGISDNNSPIPSERTAEYYRKRPCIELVRCATEELDKIISNK